MGWGVGEESGSNSSGLFEEKTLNVTTWKWHASQFLYFSETSPVQLLCSLCYLNAQIGIASFHQGPFHHQGTAGEAWRHFGVVTPRGAGAEGSSWVMAWECGSRSYRAQDGPTTENGPAPNVSGGDAEEPWAASTSMQDQEISDLLGV